MLMISDIKSKDEIYIRLSADDVRRATFIGFLDDGRVAVEQTDPPLDDSTLTSLVFFTYCSEKQKNRRLGFQARIESITADQQILLKQFTKPFFCDLRLWPRVHFDVLPKLHAYCGDQEIKVVDLSGGGTHLVLEDEDSASPAIGSFVQVKFIFEKGEATADGKILRSWTDQQGLRHVEVNFLGQPEIRKFIYNRERT
ncbi:MAG: hypothetical protein EG826_14535 [Deltaproteobacteria bacterium]|nr:hypothetical protein [Deltaproteobacteria bacterium]